MKTKPRKRNPIARAVRSPKFRPRVVKSKRVYDRKRNLNPPGSLRS